MITIVTKTLKGMDIKDLHKKKDLVELVILKYNH